MNKEELIGKLQMVYVGDKNALNELIGYYDGLKEVVELLKKENQKYKEVIDKLNNYIDNYDVFKVFSFPLMKKWEENQVKSSIDYEFKTSLIKDLKDILNEVSE